MFIIDIYVKTMKFKKIIIILIILAFVSSSVYAKPRVICEIDVKSENSAYVELKWNEKSSNNIQITGWSIVDKDILKVSYVTGSNIISGWDKRKIQGEGYKFPMKIVLEEQNTNNDSFSDLPASYQEKYSILNLYHRNIISGYDDSTFKPQNNVTRAEFAKMIVETAKYSLDTNIDSRFNDVNNSFWAKDYIMTLANKSIFEGKGKGKFDPNGNITIGEVLAVLNRTFILYEANNKYNNNLQNHWSNEDFLNMVNSKVVKSTDNYYYPYTPDNKATRVQCAVLLSRILEQLHESN